MKREKILTVAGGCQLVAAAFLALTILFGRPAAVPPSLALGITPTSIPAPTDAPTQGPPTAVPPDRTPVPPTPRPAPEPGPEITVTKSASPSELERCTNVRDQKPDHQRVCSRRKLSYDCSAASLST